MVGHYTGNIFYGKPDLLSKDETHSCFSSCLLGFISFYLSMFWVCIKLKLKNKVKNNPACAPKNICKGSQCGGCKKSEPPPNFIKCINRLYMVREMALEKLTGSETTFVPFTRYGGLHWPGRLSRNCKKIRFTSFGQLRPSVHFKVLKVDLLCWQLRSLISLLHCRLMQVLQGLRQCYSY